MRTFRQKGCKTWRVRFSVGLRKFDLPLGTRIKEVAESKARKLVHETELEEAGLRKRATQRKAETLTLEELHQWWLDVGLSPDVTPKHRAYSLNRPRKVFAECGWRYFRDVTAESFEDWRAEIFRDDELKPKTLNEYLGHLRTFFGWLEEREIIEKNPLRLVRKFKVIKEEDERAFTLEELERLIHTAPAYRACQYTFAAYTGLRRSELARLLWSRLVVENGCAKIELEARKTKATRWDMIHLHPVAFRALEMLGQITGETTGNVFSKGIAWMPTFRKDLEQAGIAEFDHRGRKLYFHSFRRTWATLLSSSGVAPRIAMQSMRHKDLRLTYGVYTDSMHLPVREALEQVPSPKSSLISSLDAGKTCPNLSTGGSELFRAKRKKTPEIKGKRPHLAGVVQM